MPKNRQKTQMGEISNPTKRDHNDDTYNNERLTRIKEENINIIKGKTHLEVEGVGKIFMM